MVYDFDEISVSTPNSEIVNDLPRGNWRQIACSAALTGKAYIGALPAH